MKIGLIDVDGHNFPNIPLMKISAWHKQQGNAVEWWYGWGEYDIVYMAKVFDDTYSPDVPEPLNAKQIIKGGTGYGLGNKLPPEIEHIMPDYSLYGTKDKAYGFLSRGCPRGCPFCIVSEKEGQRSVKVADLSEWWNGQKNIILLDPNLLACKEHVDLIGQLADSNARVDVTQGIDCRLLNEDNINALNRVDIKTIHFAWDMMKESKAVLKGLELYARLGAIQSDRNRNVYVLVNYDTTMEENLYRVYKLRELKYNPYVMIYDKPNACREIKRLQRWVNNKFIWRTCERFEDYNKTPHTEGEIIKGLEKMNEG